MLACDDPERSINITEMPKSSEPSASQNNFFTSLQHTTTQIFKMSLPNRFTIFVGGRPVVSPENQGDEDEYFQAEAGGPHPGPRPAVFEAQPSPDGLQLISGEFALGRHRVEDLSLRPKRVGWCKRDHSHMLQPIEVRPGRDGPELRFSGMLWSFCKEQCV